MRAQSVCTSEKLFVETGFPDAIRTLSKPATYRDHKTWVFSGLLAHLVLMQTEIQKITYEPITIRLPKTGERCPWTGLTRSALNDLILSRKSKKGDPRVKSNLLKLKENSSGIRLIDFQSPFASG